MRRTVIAVVSALAIAAGAVAVVRAVPHRVGNADVQRCRIGVRAWCGSFSVPLDYTDPSAGTISIGFGWVPAKDGATGTVVAQEGGPGYPSTGTTVDYVGMLGPLLKHRNLLVVDARGTGRSTPVDCRPLQSLSLPSPRLQSAVADCGRQLDHRFRSDDGSWVHASDLFTTASSARDLDAVLAHLDIGRVDLYGDSYGTYFAQAFLARYPHRLRSVVLDSAYEARDLDPWYRTSVSTARTAFDTVCRRASSCPSGSSGSSWARIGRLATSLRKQPVTGTVGTGSKRQRLRVDVSALVNIVNDAGYDTYPYEHLDPAARAYLDRRDTGPLLRLWAHSVSYDYSDYVRTPPSYYSDGLFFAVACTDYPQLFDARTTPTQRRAELARSVAALPAQTFAPFTTAEWITVLGYTEAYTACLDWPAPTHAADPPVPAGKPMNPAHVPVLVLGGELDSLTPAAGGRHVAEQLGATARAYVAANNVHLVALGTSRCGDGVVQRFIAHPHRSPRPGCLRRLPPLRMR